MDKKTKISLFIFVVAVIWIVYSDFAKSKSINWYPSFSSKHKIPYGTYVLRNELSTLFKESDIKDIRKPPYEVLKDSTLTGTYFFVNNTINFGKEELNHLLEFVNRGNDVFISTNITKIDTLNIEASSINVLGTSEYIQLRLLNTYLDTLSAQFKSDLFKKKFTKIDTLQVEALGNVKVYGNNELKEEGVNFIRQKFGKGYFYFHLYPYAFTNYYVLNEETNPYVSSVLSYIQNEKPILWDTYYKTGKSRISSPMYYVLSSPHLKWAYYTAIIAVVLFVFFQGKRNQRYIPIITPLKNQTIAFTKTVAAMYFDKKDHKSIAQKNIHHFLEYIRSKFYTTTLNFNNEFFEYLAQKSGNDLEEVKQLFTLIKQVENQYTISAEQLLELESKIEKFKKNY